jgi:hypothetical protein
MDAIRSNGEVSNDRKMLIWGSISRVMRWRLTMCVIEVCTWTQKVFSEVSR